MKTYLFPEVAGHGEIVEWVPADVARELLEITKAVAHIGVDFGYGEFQLNDSHIEKAREAIKKSCGES
jgi:hypothetical protein